MLAATLTNIWNLGKNKDRKGPYKKEWLLQTRAYLTWRKWKEIKVRETDKDRNVSYPVNVTHYVGLIDFKIFYPKFTM